MPNVQIPILRGLMPPYRAVPSITTGTASPLSSMRISTSNGTAASGSRGVIRRARWCLGFGSDIAWQHCYAIQQAPREGLTEK
jgi:hypothetical protein